jgi:hypothetical protein
MEGVPYPEKMDKKEYYVVKLRAKSDRLIGIAQILAFFDPKKWGDRLSLKLGQTGLGARLGELGWVRRGPSDRRLPAQP